MTFNCKNGPLHKHSTVHESKLCWGIIKPPAPPVPVAPPVRMVTESQLAYIEKLDGDLTYAYKLTLQEASAYIDKLKKEKASKPVTTDPRLDLLKGMIDMIPDGYYAVSPEAGVATTFIRLKRPSSKHDRFQGSLKVQTQHGPRLEVAAALWSSGKWSIYRSSVVESLMLLVSDYRSSALRYAQEIGKCCRCNSPLTDERSRHYGIGPECEKHRPWVIEYVDSLHASH